LTADIAVDRGSDRWSAARSTPAPVRVTAGAGRVAPTPAARRAGREDNGRAFAWRT
jgi:hypothetical protein